MDKFEVRVCMTEQCNFKCRYCKPGGEGIKNGKDALSSKELLKITDFLCQYGCTSIRLTGGEPLLRKDISEIIYKMRKKTDIKNISLVTNGSLLNRYTVEQLFVSGINSVTVSLDTLNSERFKDITGVNCLDNVLSGIDLLLEYKIPTRINTVVCKDNIKEIKSILKFCCTKKISLKLLDYVFNEYNEWNEEYYGMSSIIKEFNEKFQKSIDFPPGGLGTPMERYKVNDISVLIKDNMKGTCYSPLCKVCEKYPCQSGVVSLVLTHNGILKLCTASDFVCVDMKDIIANPQKTIDMKRFLENYFNSELKCLWKETICTN